MRLREEDNSCCPGESDPICVPKRRAAGWFGLDPSHLILLKPLGRSSSGGVGDAEDGEGVAVR